MRVFRVCFCLLLGISLILSVGVVRADSEENSSRTQNLEMDLANETAARIDKDADLQQQISSGNSANYSGTWTVNGRDYGTCPNPGGAIWSGTIRIVQESSTMIIFLGDDESTIGTIIGNTYSHHEVDGDSYLDEVITFSGTTYWGTTYYIQGGGGCYLNNFYFGERIPE